MELAQCENLIKRLMDQSNEERKVAEQTFEELCQHPDQVAQMLFTALSSPDVTVRSLAAIMIRKRINRTLYDKLSPQTQQSVRSTLITSVQIETETPVRRKIADTTGEVASMILEEYDWPEMMPFLLDSAKTFQATLRESSMLIFSRLALVIGEKLLGNMGPIKEMLSATLADPESKEVRLAALSATGCLVQSLSNMEPQMQNLTDLIPHMVQVLTSALNEQDEETARSSLEEFISVAEEAPKFFRRHMDPLVQMAIQIVTAAQLEEETRFLAVELLVTIAEQAPAMMRKQQVFLQNMVPLALQLMLVVDDVNLAEWNATTDDDDDTDLSSLDVGKDCLDRLALSLGGKTVFNLAFRQDLVPAFLEHPDWKYRHAALCCISQVAEGCKKQMTDNLGTIIDQLIARFLDPHPRVRWAAINAMGQLETDLGPDLQEQYHAKVLPALVSIMDDVENHRVQSHAAAAIINFTENCSKEIMLPYLEPLLGKLVGLLLGGQRIVQEQAITAIASVADCVAESFAPYYGRIMPTLKQMLVQCTAKEHRLLRGKTMECVSLIGIAVGRDIFINDAKEVMDQFLATQTSAMDPDDPQASYLLQAWGRVAKALGHDFIPYLNVVMPPLLKSADIKPDEQVAETADGDEDDEDEEGIATVIVKTDEGTTKVAIKTSALEEKATACNMLVCYFAELQEGMFPYIEHVAKIMVPLLSFLFSDEVRIAAAALMPELAKSAVVSLRSGLCDVGFVNNLLSFMFDKLIESVVEEPEVAVQSALVEALHESLSNGGVGCLGAPEKVNATLKALADVTKEVLGRAMARAEAQKDEDFDDEEEETQQEEAERDDALLEEVSSALASLTKTHPEVVSEAFQTHVEVFGKLVSSDLSNHRRIGICIVDEVLENMQHHGQRYLPQLLPPLVLYCQDPNPEVRQAAVFGLGVCAQFGGQSFSTMIGDVVPRILALINHPQARSDEVVHATDNAVSALGKVIEFHGEGIDRRQLMTVFLSYLPVTGDMEEGVQVHGRLCSFLDRGEPVVMEEPQKWIPQILMVFGHIVGSESVDQEVTARIKALLQRMQSSMPDIFNGSVSQISQEHQGKLSALMQSP
mmetsp:Transcript_3719/g.9358  ORF Transcript_3719/g.9358 Transcript_3719/m.9358 type:complete len:1094 (+) Transcript_3719:94-3375(+)